MVALSVGLNNLLKFWFHFVVQIGGSNFSKSYIFRDFETLNL